jgi:HEAT repeat protein
MTRVEHSLRITAFLRTVMAYIAAPRTRFLITLICLVFGRPAAAAELDAVRIALLVEAMGTRGSGYDATELHALGADGLNAVLDHLLPDTAAPKPLLSLPPEEDVHRLIEQLDADSFHAREAATTELIAQARGRRNLIEQASASDSLEVRLRIERILASWESRPAARLSAYLSGFWKYVEGIGDAERLELLARRTIETIRISVPEGDRLHLLRLCIAGVAHGRDQAGCDLLRPLVQHDDVRVAALVTETIGGYKTDPRFMPRVLIDALTSRHRPAAEAALRFVLGCQDEQQRPAVRQSLHAVFAGSDESLKFQACLPLVRDYQDTNAWTYVVQQAASHDANRVRTALNWIGDTKNCGQPPTEELLKSFSSLLIANEPLVRRAAATALGTFNGEETARLLASRRADDDENVVRAATAGLLNQPDRELVERVLRQSAASRDSRLSLRSSSVLEKLASP